MKIFTKFIAGAGALLCLAGVVQAQTPIWDTLSTQCTRLVVDDRCEVGVTKREGVNLDFVALGGDCDPGANVYLYSGGPFAIRKNGSSYVYSSSVWQSYLMNSTGWGLMPSGQTPGPISGTGYTGFQTSTMWNTDHSIAVQKTYYAPSVSDSCNFMIQKSVFFGVGGPKTNVTIGEMVDCDVPSNGAAPGFNTSGIAYSSGSFVVYQRGIGTIGCQPDQNRYAAVAFLDMYSQTELLVNQCVHSRDAYSQLTWSVDTMLKRIDTLSNSDQGNYYWNLTGASGLMAVAGQLDLATVLTYKHNYTLDTLTVYTVLVSVQNGVVADLDSSINKARQFYRHHLRPGCPNFFSCCWANSPDGRRGNVDCDIDGSWDISDLSALIDHLYISFTPLCCPEAADCDGDGNIDISDLTCLIDWLYICFGCWPAFCP
jgi:hypothetical protein